MMDDILDSHGNCMLAAAGDVISGSHLAANWAGCRHHHAQLLA
jgi:hypothetical protein